MKSFISITAAFAALLLTGCTIDPTIIKRPDGTIVQTTGGHFASKVLYEKKFYQGSDGSSLLVERHGYDSTQVPKAAITGYTALGLSADQVTTTKTTEGTTRALAREETSRAATKGAQDVQIKALSSPLPEGLTPQSIPR